MHWVLRTEAREYSGHCRCSAHPFYKFSLAHSPASTCSAHFLYPPPPPEDCLRAAEPPSLISQPCENAWELTSPVTHWGRSVQARLPLTRSGSDSKMSFPPQSSPQGHTMAGLGLKSHLCLAAFLSLPCFPNSLAISFSWGYFPNKSCTVSPPSRV